MQAKHFLLVLLLITKSTIIFNHLKFAILSLFKFGTGIETGIGTDMMYRNAVGFNSSSHSLSCWHYGLAVALLTRCFRGIPHQKPVEVGRPEIKAHIQISSAVYQQNKLEALSCSFCLKCWSFKRSWSEKHTTPGSKWRIMREILIRDLSPLCLST